MNSKPENSIKVQLRFKKQVMVIFLCVKPEYVLEIRLTFQCNFLLYLSHAQKLNTYSIYWKWETALPLETRHLVFQKRIKIIMFLGNSIWAHTHCSVFIQTQSWAQNLNSMASKCTLMFHWNKTKVKHHLENNLYIHCLNNKKNPT